MSFILTKSFIFIVQITINLNSKAEVLIVRCHLYRLYAILRCDVLVQRESPFCQKSKFLDFIARNKALESKVKETKKPPLNGDSLLN